MGDRSAPSAAAWLAAAKAGNTAELQRLLDAAPDGDSRRALCRARAPGTSSAGHSALHWAAAGGHAEALAWLLTQDVDVNVRNNGESVPLHSACANGHAALVRLLCDTAADGSARDSNGQTPFDLAAARSHEEAAAALPPAARGQTPHGYLQLSVAGAPVGTLIFALDGAPCACANFLGLAQVLEPEGGSRVVNKEIQTNSQS